MRLRLAVVLLCVLSLALGASRAEARPLQSHHRAQAPPSAPPFPWSAVLETVGPIFGIWLVAVLLRRAINREKTNPLDTGEVTSLPVAWFAAMSRLFEKKAPERKIDLPQVTVNPDSASLTSDS
jgi:hypothetical protein